MRPDDPLDDSGEEFSLLVDEDATDILDASTHAGPSDSRDAQPKVDANFFNKFDDDFDESDMTRRSA